MILLVRWRWLLIHIGASESVIRVGEGIPMTRLFSFCFVSTIFLSSSESQDGWTSSPLLCEGNSDAVFPVVNSLWKGDLIQKMNEKFDVDCELSDSLTTLTHQPYHVVDVSYSESQTGSFWSHVNPSRLCVPRYQNFFRIVVWLFFLFVYSQAGLSYSMYTTHIMA